MSEVKQMELETRFISKKFEGLEFFLSWVFHGFHKQIHSVFQAFTRRLVPQYSKFILYNDNQRIAIVNIVKKNKARNIRIDLQKRNKSFYFIRIKIRQFQFIKTKLKK